MALSQNIADIRINYSRQELTEASVSQNPTQQFQQWLQEALDAEVDEPTAMVLSTVSGTGKPSARVVLLKGLDEQGYTFFTNYDSRKGHDLEENPYASLTFFWPALERQVRIEGKIVKVAAAESDTYFQSRPKGSQIGAWASPQSQVIEAREVLEQREQEFSEKFANQNVVPRPAHWGGYRLQPDRLEFWQGRPSRLHDRIMYVLEGHNWEIKRLAP
ncbi:pyridoxamine 5'-phosphate oxidase [Pontibacter oryzae]|uniref:Pyridoxine/pyridoxamine 5'-phosphate oxidase n=1 Tax=Pontibacter oryzae TaxID=2304593 RepID=A0A399SC51_9BACT|nr:pyridoxamine 5'-phosphate oxidase [Pontibacter oryzae]RIJ41646.1 pyridoxamine 5'-phosphate oxidase [Pontibacter oryzae]